MTKTVIQWSGGADSTVIVDEMLRNTTDELVLQHLLFKSDGVEDSNNLRIKRHNLIAAAQVVAIKQISDYWKREGYRPFILEIIPYQHHFRRSTHGVAGPFFGARAVRKYNADRFITGSLKSDRFGGLLSREGNYAKELERRRTYNRRGLVYLAPQLQALFDLEMQYSTSGDSDYSHVKWEKPLVDRGWEKNDIAEHLPPELRKLVVTCDNPTTYEDHWERCEECRRCNLWESANRDAERENDR